MKNVEDQQIFDALDQLKIIDAQKLKDTFTKATESNTPFSDILLQNDLISDSNLGKVVADLYGIPFIALKTTPVSEDIIHIVPERFARANMTMVFNEDNGTLFLATSNPNNTHSSAMLAKKTGKEIKTYYATPQDITNSFSHYVQDATSAFHEIIKEHIDKARDATETAPPIIKIVDTIIEYGYQNEASDIHVEPTEEYSLVRFRIDGVLHDIVRLPAELHPQIVTRIKVLANLRTDEHQEAQDGKIRHDTDQENLDLRVSIVPITKGENIVMRLLSEKSRNFALEELGLSESDLIKVEKAYNSPHGMILSTGPTGSGKTTTLYAILKLLNKQNVNIMTIENPVEYDMENVNQIQVNNETNLTFAEGLRSIVRQDPDIIFVGEIRDEETAGIAVNSAMTGHLVLSTLHTNDAATTMPRLIDMEIEPFLIASTVQIIIAQRLVRKICTKCRISYEIKGDQSPKSLSKSTLQKLFNNKKTARLYKGKGCSVCHQTGYSGRIGIFEVLQITDDVRKAITEEKDSKEIYKLAVKEGMETMMDDGIQKVGKGITTIEEIMRVTKES